MTITVEYRSLGGTFPRELRLPSLRVDARFDTPHERTVPFLKNEVKAIGGDVLVIGADLAPSDADEADDSPPEYGAPSLTHPGVVVYCNSEWGWLMFCCDDAIQWQANLRSIFLTMSALRQTLPHGNVTLDGEPYRGYLLDLDEPEPTE